MEGRGPVKLLLELKTRRENGPKLTMVTCYDAWSARLLLETPVDALLVGDSVAMVVHGESNTLGATLDMMALHTRAVARAVGDKKWVVADMPFLSTRKGLDTAMAAAQALLTAGAHAVKLEGWDGHEDVVRAMILAGIPVVGHLGLTPQFEMAFGGLRVQGREADRAEQIARQARELEQAGAVALVLECVPSALARRIQAELKIPVFGIGAGADVAGQVLVLHDALGLLPGFKPKFLRTFAPGAEVVQTGMRAYCEAVRAGTFPSPEESYT